MVALSHKVQRHCVTGQSQGQRRGDTLLRWRGRAQGHAGTTPGEALLSHRSSAPAQAAAQRVCSVEDAAFPSHPKATSRKGCNVSSVTRNSLKQAPHNLDESTKHLLYKQAPWLPRLTRSGLSRRRTAGHRPWVPGEEGDRKLAVVQPPEQTQLPESAKS